MTPGGQLKPDLWTCKDNRQPYLSTFSISVSVLFHQIDSWPCQPVPSSISPLFIWPKLIIRVVSTTLPLLHLSLHNCTHSRNDAGQKKCLANSAKKIQIYELQSERCLTVASLSRPQGQRSSSWWWKPVSQSGASTSVHSSPPLAPPLPATATPRLPWWLPPWLTADRSLPENWSVWNRQLAGNHFCVYVQLWRCACPFLHVKHSQYIHYIIQYTPYTDVGSICALCMYCRRGTQCDCACSMNIVHIVHCACHVHGALGHHEGCCEKAAS